jgi:hypothetical protein
MDYFRKAPGPTPCEELPLPKHKQNSDSHRSDKRKLSEEFSSKALARTSVTLPTHPRLVFQAGLKKKLNF